LFNTPWNELPPAGQGTGPGLDIMRDANNLVLIVEDDRWTRKALVSILKHHGWEALTASILSEGLEL
jgi:hypothetical protein